MKRTAIAAAGIFVVMSMLAGCGGDDTEETMTGQVQVEENTSGAESDHEEVSDEVQQEWDETRFSGERQQEEEEMKSSGEVPQDEAGLSGEVLSEPDHAENSDETQTEMESGEETDEKERQKAVRSQQLLEEKEMIDISIPIYAGAHIAVVSKGTDGEFWDLVRQGMEDAVDAVNEAYGFEKEEVVTMNFEGSEDEMDIETQVNTIDAVIAENPDVLCISVGDMDSCQAQLEAARENGIPVIAFDSNVSESELITAYRATDNKSVGKIAAQKLAEQLNGEGAVAIFSAPEKTESSRDRQEGFESVLETYPDMGIVEIVYLDQVEDMKSSMQTAIIEHPELRGVFCSNAEVADIYLELGEILETRSIAMVGVDATSRQQEAIHNGEEIGVISQDPHQMGFETIWTALLATVPEDAGVEVEIVKNEFLEPAWIDLTNIDDITYGKYLY